MANYYGQMRTNYFKVKDEEKLRELLDNCIADEDEIHLYPKTEEDGSKSFAFCSEGSFFGLVTGKEDEPEYDFDAFTEKLQAILPSGEAVIITEIGREKMRYLHGSVTVITQDSCHFNTLDRLGKSMARDMLNNPDWDTQNDY